MLPVPDVPDGLALYPSQGDFNVKKLTSVMLALAVLAAVALAADPSIKEIMTKAHKGGDSLIEVVGKAAKADTPDWDTINKSTDQLVDLGKSLSKAEFPKDAPKGTKEGWAKQTMIYNEQVAALDAAAGKKDKDATFTAFTKLKNSCGGCHIDFKPKKP
jgi:cytochrome c556